MRSNNNNHCLLLIHFRRKYRLLLPLLLALAFSAHGGKKLPDKKPINEDMLSSGKPFTFYLSVSPIVQASSAFYRLLGQLRFSFYPVITGQATALLTGDVHLATVPIPNPLQEIQHQASPNWPATTMNLFDPDDHDLATDGNGTPLPAELPQPEPCHACFSGTSIVPVHASQAHHLTPSLSSAWNLPALLAHPDTAEGMNEEELQTVFQGMEYQGVIQNPGSGEIFPEIHVFSNMAVDTDYRLYRVHRGAVSPSNVHRLARKTPGLNMLLVCVTRNKQYGGFVLVITNLLVTGMRKELYHQIRSWDRKPDDGSPPASGNGGSFRQTISL